MNDAELVKRLRNGDEEAMHTLILQYERLVAAVVRGFLGKRTEDVEECTADAFFTVWKKIDTLQNPESLKAFLLCTARNLACSRYRRLQRQPLTLLPEDNDLADDTDLLLDFERKDNEALLRQEIMKLREPNRELFVRRYYYGEAISQLTSRFRMEEKQIYNLLYRSKQQLKKALEKGVSEV